MDEFVKGAVYAKNGIIKLIIKKQSEPSVFKQSYAIEAEQKTLKEAQVLISNTTFLDKSSESVPHTSFEAGASYVKNRAVGLLGVLQGEIGHSLHWSPEYQTIDRLCEAIKKASF